MQRHFGFETNGVGFYLFDQIASPKAFKETYREQLDAAGWDEAERERVIDEVLARVPAQHRALRRPGASEGRRVAVAQRFALLDRRGSRGAAAPGSAAPARCRCGARRAGTPRARRPGRPRARAGGRARRRGDASARGGRRRRGFRAARARHARPSTRARATARLSVTTGPGAMPSSTSYSARICGQSVAASVTASSCTAAIAACTWYGPIAPVPSVRSISETPSAICAASQSDRSCSASGMSSPARSRAARRASVSSISASSPTVSGSVAGRSADAASSIRVRRIASAVSSVRCDRSPGGRGVALVEHQVQHVAHHGHALGELRRCRPRRIAPPAALIAALARLMRCAIVASGTRKALAISAVVRPPTARSVSASCDGGDTAGWQQSTSRSRVSSVSERRRRAASTAFEIEDRLLATATCALAAPGIHQPPVRRPRRARRADRRGRPARGHCCAAAIRASCTASSHCLELPVPAHERARARAAPARAAAPRSTLARTNGCRHQTSVGASPSGRTSTNPDHLTMRPTISRRRSSDSTSTIQKPMSDSFDSAYGPSVTATGPPSA